jgi:hypothetical protein
MVAFVVTAYGGGNIGWAAGASYTITGDGVNTSTDTSYNNSGAYNAFASEYRLAPTAGAQSPEFTTSNAPTAACVAFGFKMAAPATNSRTPARGTVM